MQYSSIHLIGFLLIISPSFGQMSESLDTPKQLYAEGKYSESLQALQQVNPRATSDFGYWLLKGDCLQKEENFSAAINAYKEAAKLNKNSALLNANWGAAHFNLNQMDKAEKLIKRALKLEPDLAEGHYFLGNLQYSEFSIAAALRSYNRAVERSPDYRDALFMRAAANAELKNYGDALRDYNRVLQLDPGLVLATFNSAVILLIKEEYEDAVSLFQSLEPEAAQSQTDYYYYLGEALYFVGEKERACENYKLAADLGDNESAELYYRHCLNKEERQKPLETRTIRATF